MVLRPDRADLLSRDHTCEPVRGPLDADSLAAACKDLSPLALVFVGKFEVHPIETLSFLRSRDLCVRAAIVRSESELCLSGVPAEGGLADSFWRFRGLFRANADSNRARRHVLIDLRGRELSIAGRSSTFSPAEFRLLVLLMRYPDLVFSRQELLHRICSKTPFVHPNSVNVMVRRIRSRIEWDPRAPDLLQNAYGLGYFLNGSIDSFTDRITGESFVTWPRHESVFA
jgi:DNA-binding winged helix-turn-helix (wHTH) protein